MTRKENTGKKKKKKDSAKKTREEQNKNFRTEKYHN